MSFLMRALFAVCLVSFALSPAARAQAIARSDLPRSLDTSRNRPEFVPGQVLVRWAVASARDSSERRGLQIQDLALRGLVSIVEVDGGAERSMAALLSRV